MELNKLYHLDCMAGMKEFPDKFFDLAITDPPYFPEANLHYFSGKTISSTGVKRKNYTKSSSWKVPGNDYYQELMRVSKNQIIWGINYFAEFQGVPSGRIVWDKQRSGLIGSFSDGEIASCSLINGVRFYRYRWDGMLQGNMKNREQKFHVTQKPVPLYHWVLNTYAKPGEKILDTHAGSASSLMACIDLGFDYVGFEIDENYHKLACERIENHLAQQCLFRV